MWGLTGAVQWWEEWQLRVLVLTSLLIQFFFIFFPLLRGQAISGLLRFTMWLAYHAGDAVAIYGLATLFNRHKNEGDGCVGAGSSSSNTLLEVVWAPVLVIHLGGQDGVTAYNIEDNELWSRHLLTAVSQVTVAVYVFCKSWPPDGDKWLLAAAISLFITGLVKCFVEAWAFKRASIYNLVSSAATKKQKKDGSVYNKLDKYVKDARDIVDGQQPENHHQVIEEEDSSDELERLVEGHGEASKLFIDLTSPYPDRINIFKKFWRIREERAYASVQKGLARAFLLLYTKLKTSQAIIPGAFYETGRSVDSVGQAYMKLARWLIPWAPMALFHRSHREAYNGIDVKITYALLCCTAVLEYSSTLPFFIGCVYVGVWPERVAQYSLVGYFVRNKKHNIKMRIVSFVGCKNLVDQLWCMEPCFSSPRITHLVLLYLQDGWNRKIQDAASYRSFNNHSSHWGLYMKRPFDESVLLWHIATDFCFFSTVSSSSSELAAEVPAVLCKQMSNYMAYLLFVNPEMLLPGSRRNLFTAAHEELQDLFKSDSQPLPRDNERELTLKIIDKLKSSSQADSGGLIHEAWMLAQMLETLGDNDKWKVIQRVWVEMLCFSASRCRGYLHAKALGGGGEFLSYVWLLLFYMGMETFTDKLHREDLPIPSEEAAGNNATAVPITSASEAHSDTCGASDPPSTSEIRMAQDMV